MRREEWEAGMEREALVSGELKSSPLIDIVFKFLINVTHV